MKLPFFWVVTIWLVPRSECEVDSPKNSPSPGFGIRIWSRTLVLSATGSSVTVLLATVLAM